MPKVTSQGLALNLLDTLCVIYLESKIQWVKQYDIDKLRSFHCGVHVQSGRHCVMLLWVRIAEILGT